MPMSAHRASQVRWVARAAIATMIGASPAAAFPPIGWRDGSAIDACPPDAMSTALKLGKGNRAMTDPGSYDAPIDVATFAADIAPRTRRDLDQIDDDDREVLKRGFELMQRLADTEPDDPRGMVNFTLVHCFYCSKQLRGFLDIH